MRQYSLKAGFRSLTFIALSCLLGFSGFYLLNHNSYPNFFNTQFGLFSARENLGTAQTINFPAINDRIFGNNTVNLNASASSGLPVNYQVKSGSATLSGSKLTITGVGIITVEATQAGNVQYNPATPVQQAFLVDFQNQSEINPDISCLKDVDLTFVVIGSSSAAGYKVEPLDSAWAFRFETYLKAINPNNQVFNYGKNGYSSYNLMPTSYTSPTDRDNPDPTRNITKALSHNPDGIIVNCPSNDVKKGYMVEELVENFKAIYNIAVANNIPIWITTTQPRSFAGESNADEQIKVNRQIEGKNAILDVFGAYALDFWSVIDNGQGRILPQYANIDSLHVNKDGHALFFQQVINKNVLGRVVGLQYPGTDFSFSVDLGEDVSAVQGNPVTLDAGPGYSSYLWSDGSTSRTLTVGQTGNYWVKVGNNAGCEASDTVSVTFQAGSSLQLNISPASATMDNLTLQINSDDLSTDVMIKLVQTAGKSQANIKVKAQDIINGFQLKNVILLEPGTYHLSVRQASMAAQQIFYLNP